jgi:Ca2+-binding RTX toxin-like protein
MAKIIGTIGDDNLTGGSGDDAIYGFDPANQAVTNGGNDTLDGAGGNDRLYGGNDNDTLIGGAGNDTLNGGFGFDSMAGGLGDDVYSIFDANATTDAVIEGLNEGIDTVLLTNYVSSYTLPANVENLTTTEGLAIHDLHGNELDNVIIGNDYFNYFYTHGGSDTLAGGKADDRYYLGSDQDTTIIENAGEGYDSIYVAVSYQMSANIETMNLEGTADINGTGNDQANSIFGNAGNNTLIGGGGNDYLAGGKGYDTVDYSGSDHAVGSAGDTDTLREVELVLGSSFGDTFSKSYGNNGWIQLIDGGAGDDTFLGGIRAHTYLGGVGNDTFVGGTGDEIFVGGIGNDSIYGGSGVDTADYSASINAVFVSLALAGPQNTGNGTGIDTLSNIENLTGGAVHDNLTGNGLDNVLVGLNGNDVLTAGAGNDRLIGGNGTDLMSGDAGIDTADYTGDGRAVNVNLSSGAAQNTGYGLDTLSGIENLTAGAGNDRLVGSTGVNELHGGAGKDTISGIGGADTLYGEAGDDNIAGGAGNDLLVGGAGIDELLGGADADTFVFNAISETTVSGRDTIDDFQQGLDHIDLSAIDANVGASGDQAFSFIGSVAFSHAAAQLRQTGDGAGNTIIEGDVQGDGVADFQILLKGTYALTGSDFVL